MKLQEVLFQNPIKIIQVFRNINIYEKAEKSFELRKEKISWKPMFSKSGYVFKDELFLPEQILSNPDFKNCNLITLNDNNNINENTFPKENTNFNNCFNLISTKSIDIFELKMKEDLELHLKYGYFEVGIPERQNFKLCNINKNQSIEIKINGKTDSSLSSRRARVFKEQYYIYDYIGDFHKCKILKEPFDSHLKHVPENRRVIDLIKQLW